MQPVSMSVHKVDESRITWSGKLDLTPDALDRACKLLNASLVSESHEDSTYSIVFKMGAQQYYITFGLPDELVLLMPSHSETSQDIQFTFKCNAISFHPRGTPKWHAICFHETQRLVKTPKLLIACNETGACRLLFYSIPGMEVDGELEFPNQL
jgi:hypothetical protein